MLGTRQNNIMTTTGRTNSFQSDSLALINLKMACTDELISTLDVKPEHKKSSRQIKNIFHLAWSYIMCWVKKQKNMIMYQNYCRKSNIFHATEMNLPVSIMPITQVFLRSGICCSSQITLLIDGTLFNPSPIFCVSDYWLHFASAPKR